MKITVDAPLKTGQMLDAANIGLNGRAYRFRRLLLQPAENKVNARHKEPFRWLKLFSHK